MSIFVFIIFSVVGMGSLCFHATLLYEMQVRTINFKNICCGLSLFFFVSSFSKMFNFYFPLFTIT